LIPSGEEGGREKGGGERGLCKKEEEVSGHLPSLVCYNYSSRNEKEEKEKEK